MRLQTSSSLLCVIDVQERLLAAMSDADRVVARCGRLAEAARIVGVPALLTEQYPQGLGPTPAALAALLPPPLVKSTFSCCGAEGFTAALTATPAAVLAGLETHICIAQTALDLLATGMTVFVAVDAVSARHGIDHDTGLRRLESAGAILTTTEAVIFEWCGGAAHPQFQALRRLVR